MVGELYKGMKERLESDVDWDEVCLENVCGGTCLLDNNVLYCGEHSKMAAEKILAALEDAYHKGILDAELYINEMPLGVEWPRYNTGELVEFGNEHKPSEHGVEPVDCIAFTANGYYLFPNFFAEDSLCYKYGECIKRPEPEVYDADGVKIEVGDTVWSVDTGKQFEITGFNKKSDDDIRVCSSTRLGFLIPSKLTHIEPDSQQSIDKDAELSPRDYCEKFGEARDKSERLLWQKQHLLKRQRELDKRGEC